MAIGVARRGVSGGSRRASGLTFRGGVEFGVTKGVDWMDAFEGDDAMEGVDGVKRLLSRRLKFGAGLRSKFGMGFQSG